MSLLCVRPAVAVVCRAENDPEKNKKSKTKDERTLHRRAGCEPFVAHRRRPSCRPSIDAPTTATTSATATTTAPTTAAAAAAAAAAAEHHLSVAVDLVASCVSPFRFFSASFFFQ